MTSDSDPTAAVMDSDRKVVGSHDNVGGGERVVPYHCPFCAEEDLRPHASASNAWYCRACLRIFSVRFLGMEPPPSTVVPSTEYPSTEYGGTS